MYQPSAGFQPAPQHPHTAPGSAAPHPQAGHAPFAPPVQRQAVPSAPGVQAPPVPVPAAPVAYLDVAQMLQRPAA